MTGAPPHTLSVKRKRNEAPVDELVIANDNDGIKRLKRNVEGGAFSWKLVPNPNTSVPSALLSPSTADRRFFLDPETASRVKHVLVERPTGRAFDETAARELQAAVTPDPSTVETPRPRKRPGAGSALNRAKEIPQADPKKPISGPSEDDVRKFEEFSESVEKEESRPKHVKSQLKYKPKVPAQRFKDRHPEKAAALDHDAMEVDSEEYVYDTYVRQEIVPDANGKIPEPQGTVGFIVIDEDDQVWWNGEEDSDKEIATDDEDENAEDYYANDYPEDELSSDDEYDRNPYKQKYRRGSGGDEEYDLNDYDEDENNSHMRSDEDEDDYHFRMTSGQAKRPGGLYWGAQERLRHN